MKKINITLIGLLLTLALTSCGKKTAPKPISTEDSSIKAPTEFKVNFRENKLIIRWQLPGDRLLLAEEETVKLPEYCNKLNSDNNSNNDFTNFFLRNSKTGKLKKINEKEKSDQKKKKQFSNCASLAQKNKVFDKPDLLIKEFRIMTLRPVPGCNSCSPVRNDSILISPEKRGVKISYANKNFDRKTAPADIINFRYENQNYYVSIDGMPFPYDTLFAVYFVQVNDEESSMTDFRQSYRKIKIPSPEIETKIFIETKKETKPQKQILLKWNRKQEIAQYIINGKGKPIAQQLYYGVNLYRKESDFLPINKAPLYSGSYFLPYRRGKIYIRFIDRFGNESGASIVQIK